jgi:hypothetical protein
MIVMPLKLSSMNVRMAQRGMTSLTEKLDSMPASSNLATVAQAGPATIDRPGCAEAGNLYGLR